VEQKRQLDSANEIMTFLQKRISALDSERSHMLSTEKELRDMMRELNEAKNKLEEERQSKTT
jgi:hypothetical protein